MERRKKIEIAPYPEAVGHIMNTVKSSLEDIPSERKNTSYAIEVVMPNPIVQSDVYAAEDALAGELGCMVAIEYPSDGPIQKLNVLVCYDYKHPAAG